jgi:asparagine synthase (glutamine-hydrolysing)
VRHGAGKWVVRQLARQVLPADVVDRPKVGFRVPLDAWFRSGLRELARDRLLDGGSLARAMLDRAAIERLLDDHERGRRDEANRIWTLLSLDVWHTVFLARGGPGPALAGTVPAVAGGAAARPAGGAG